MKVIVLIIGLGIGFGGGVWWGHKNPEAAAKLSAEEERRVLEAKIALTEKFKAKLEQLKSDRSTPGSGFVAGGGNASEKVDALKAETEKEEAEMKKELEKLK